MAPCEHRPPQVWSANSRWVEAAGEAEEEEEKGRLYLAAGGNEGVDQG